MEHNKCNSATILSIIALSVSSVTIALFFIKVSPNSVVDGNTFISILAAFIGIFVTILIGYQVYNAVEIKQELSKIDIIKEEVERDRLELNKQKQEVDAQLKSLNNKMEISRCVSLSDANVVHNPILSFVRLHEALQYLLSSDSFKEDFVWYKKELCERMMVIDKTDFGLDVANMIQQLKDCYKVDMENVMAHENYFMVKDWYEEMMKRFDKVLDNIAKETSAEECDSDSSHPL